MNNTPETDAAYNSLPLLSPAEEFPATWPNRKYKAFEWNHVNQNLKTAIHYSPRPVKTRYGGRI
jgi:hypothetical protein